MSLSEHFIARVMPEPMSGCWFWTSSIDSKGYGRYYSKGKRHRAHRFAYQAIHGPIPAGLELDHLCRVRSCVNPTHLEAVTHRENARRSPVIGKTWRIKAEATHCIRGHRFDAANTYVRDNGTRHCRACATLRRRALRQGTNVICTGCRRHAIVPGCPVHDPERRRNGEDVSATSSAE